MTANIIHIFGKASVLNKILGVLEAALIKRDEITTLDQLDELISRNDQSETHVTIIRKTLDTLSGWGNPHFTMTAAGRVIKSAKTGSALSETGLAYYLDSANQIAATRPMTAIGGYTYAMTYAMGTVYEEKIYEGLANLCRDPHPAHYSIILQGLLEMDQDLTEDMDGENLTPLTSYILKLADMIAPFDPQDALDGYSTTLGNMSEDDPRFTETVEKLLEMCRQVSLFDEDGAQIGLEQIIRITDGRDPAHLAATSLKKIIDSKLTQGDYESTAPVAPADFLGKKGCQPG